MHKKKSILAVLSICILNACTVGPDYQKPKVELPPSFVLQDVFDVIGMADEDQSPIPPQWWTGFDDPILNNIVEKALINNPEIRAAYARTEQAQAEARLASAGNKPQIDSSANAALEERRNLDGDNDDSTNAPFSLGLGALLPLDIFGRTKRSVEAAEANLDFAKAALNAVTLQISSDVTAEYLRLRGNQRQLELLDESIDLQEKTLSIVRTRYETGLAPELDLQRAIRSVENLRASRAPLVEDLQNNRNRLSTLAGDFPGSYETELQSIAPIPSYNRNIPKELPITVLNTRPDVKQAEANLKEAVALIGVAEADFYPSLSLGGDIRIGLTGLDGTSATDALIATISALINQTISNGGARQSRKDIAIAESKEQLALYEQVLQESVEEVEITLAAIQASLNRQGSLEKVVTASSRSFRQAEILYQQGLISFLDVVDAQRSLADAEQNLASEKTNYAVQIATLFNVLGTKI